MSNQKNQYTHNLDDFFQKAPIPVIPEVAQTLIATLSSGDIDIERVRSLMAKDATITGKVVRAANAAAIGLKKSVTTLDDALTMIGTVKARTVALAACMNIAFPEVPGMSRAEFWKKTMKCAGFARWLADGTESEAEEAWLGGMMLLLGKVVILQTIPDVLPAHESESLRPGDRWRHQKSVLGFTEAEVAAELTRRWLFPAHFVDALRMAADPGRGGEINQLAGLLHLAGLLADVPANEPDPVAVLPEHLLQSLGLDAKALRGSMPGEDSFMDLADI